MLLTLSSTENPTKNTMLTVTGRLVLNATENALERSLFFVVFCPVWHRFVAMERLVGLGLSRYLSTYIKNFSAQKFQNWALNDLGTLFSITHSFNLEKKRAVSLILDCVSSPTLEFKEEIVQELVGIPPNLQVKKVTCNQIYAKVGSTWQNKD
jgi:hypothetical protein